MDTNLTQEEKAAQYDIYKGVLESANMFISKCQQPDCIQYDIYDSNKDKYKKFMNCHFCGGGSCAAHNTSTPNPSYRNINRCPNCINRN